MDENNRYLSIKCMARGCILKITIAVTSVIVEGKSHLEPREILNFCSNHQKQFFDKLAAIKDNYTKDQLEKKIAEDITDNLIQQLKPH